jgi:hypothetical protein
MTSIREISEKLANEWSLVVMNQFAKCAVEVRKTQVLSFAKNNHCLIVPLVEWSPMLHRQQSLSGRRPGEWSSGID